jgi:hypothetical protein
MVGVFAAPRRRQFAGPVADAVGVNLAIGNLVRHALLAPPLLFAPDVFCRNFPNLFEAHANHFLFPPFVLPDTHSYTPSAPVRKHYFRGYYEMDAGFHT